MTAATIGLIGVFLGALVTQVGAIVADRRQVRSESARWRRDQKAAAYDGAIRHLLRAVNRRSKLEDVGGTFIAIISKEQVQEIFDDLVEAQFWLHTLLSRCGPSQAQRIREAAVLLDEDVGELIGGGHRSSKSSKDFPEAFSFMRHSGEIMKIVADCTREDVGASSQ